MLFHCKFVCHYTPKWNIYTSKEIILLFLWTNGNFYILKCNLITYSTVTRPKSETCQKVKHYFKVMFICKVYSDEQHWIKPCPLSGPASENFVKYFVANRMWYAFSSILRVVIVWYIEVCKIWFHGSSSVCASFVSNMISGKHTYIAVLILQ
jgi:hypothetical protein